MYKKDMIGYDEARQAVEAMIQEAKEKKGSRLSIAVAIVDSDGYLVAAARMDGAREFNTTMAIRKAFTAARWRRDTAVVRERTQKNGFSVRDFGSDYTTVPGGVIITKPGEETDAMTYTSSAFGHILGAIGVAGRIPAAEDEQIARFGVRKIQEILWPTQTSKKV